MAARTERNHVAVSQLSFEPLTASRWSDFERLFGANGACAGCWCMFPRQSSTEFARLHGEPNKAAMRALAEGVSPPGLLAYAGDLPVGWCAVAPRDHYAMVTRSRILKPVDDMLAWAIVCLFVPPAYRRQGITRALVRAGRDYALGQGARMVEGYPVDAAGRRVDNVSAWHGTVSMFREAGFVEVARRSPTRPIMRWQPVAR